MIGTKYRFSLVVLTYLMAFTASAQVQLYLGAIVRGNSQQKNIALVFTGHEFADGGPTISEALATEQIKASFFFTGDFYRNNAFLELINKLKAEGHYLGGHSDKHLLYCTWQKRDSMLISKRTFRQDLKANYAEMKKFGIKKEDARYFLPPYEWYNQTIAQWTTELGLQLVNFSSGTRSNADYTTPDMPNYRSSEAILQSIYDYEEKNDLNGFILLLHVGTSPSRVDKLYKHLPMLLTALKQKGYTFVRIDQLINPTIK